MASIKSSRSMKEQNANSLLHSSLVKANKSTLLEALKLGCNLKSLSKYGDPPVVSAAGVDPYTSHDSKSGKDKILAILDILLEHKDCHIDSRGAGGETALHRAFTVRAENRIRYLLERGCDVDIRDSRGQTALFSATLFVEGLDVLLQYQPLLDVYDVDGHTPLLHAMMSEAPDSLQALQHIADAGCDVNCVAAPDKKNGLMVTLRPDGQIPRSQQRVEKSIILIAHGTDVNGQDREGKTALHYAVSSQCVDLIKVLLKNKASVDIKDTSGLTVQDMIKNGDMNPQVARLIERAADKSSRLLPYEEALVALETLFEALTDDGEVPKEKKLLLQEEINSLERSIEGLLSSGRGTHMMSVEHKRKLVNKQEVLCEEMMPHFILPSLRSDKILTEEDVQEISAEKSRKQMCVKLLQIIVHRGNKAFPALLRALHDSKQAHVCEILCSDDNKIGVEG